MERGLLLFTNLVLCFVLVVSYPRSESGENLEPPDYFAADPSLLGPRRPQNFNYNVKSDGLFHSQPSSFGLSQRNQNQQSGFGIPQHIPKNDYPGIQLAQPFDQRLPPQNHNNFGLSSERFQAPQNIPEILPPAFRKTQQFPISAYQNKNVVPSEPWGSDQRLSLQNENNQQPYTPNTFVDPVYNPVSNVDPRSNYVNYQYGYPRHQIPAPINPVKDYNYYGQKWPMQNQYQMATQKPGRSQQWPETGYQNSPQWDPQISVEPSINNGYNRQEYSAYPLAGDNVSAPNVDPASNLPEQVYQNNETQTVPSQQPVKDYSNNQKRYILVYTNGSYEHVDNLDGIVENETQLKSKDVPSHILAIVELEDNISEMEYENPSEPPFDTGISKIPHDTNNNWNPSYQDYPGTLRNPVILSTELHNSNTHTTSENTDMDYFQPEYIMPIQSTSANSIDITTDRALVTTNANVDETIKNSTNLPIPETTGLVQNSSAEDLTSDYNFDFSEEDPNSFEDYDQMYEVKAPGGISVEAIPSPFSKTRVKSDEYSTSVAYGDDFVINVSNDQPSNTPYDIPDSKFEKITGNGVQEETINYSKEDQNGADVTTPTDASPATSKSDKPQDDVKTVHTIPDLADLKTIVDKPIVWFRPDENFWEKVAKGEQSYDVVSIYDVRCVPKLIERRTTVHHYPNGTEIVDFVEYLWDHANDLNPKTINTNRVVKHKS